MNKNRYLLRVMCAQVLFMCSANALEKVANVAKRELFPDTEAPFFRGVIEEKK